MDALKTARSRFPQAVEPWTTEAQLLGQEKKYDEALACWIEPSEALGDRVEFRLARAVLWVRKGGPKALAALNGLGDDLETFPKESRRTLLATLATELTRQQDSRGGGPDVVAAGRAGSRGASIPTSISSLWHSSPPTGPRSTQADRGHREDRPLARPLLPGGLPDLAGGPQPRTRPSGSGCGPMRGPC